MSASMPSPRDRPQDRPGLQVQGLFGASGWILLGLVASSYSTSNSTASYRIPQKPLFISRCAAGICWPVCAQLRRQGFLRGLGLIVSSGPQAAFRSAHVAVVCSVVDAEQGPTDDMRGSGSHGDRAVVATAAAAAACACAGDVDGDVSSHVYL